MTAVRPLIPPEELRRGMGAEAAAVLDEMVAEVSADPSRIGRLFPAAARRTRRGPLPTGDGAVPAEDAVRVELVAAAAAVLDPPALLEELRALYRFGDSDEKRGVLHALNGVPTDADLDCGELLLDALRTNDTRLIAAAMGAHACRLSDDAWRQGVLKCLFTGVPVTEVAGLRHRADDALAGMVSRYADERRAAGRDVPADVATVLDVCTTEA